MFLYESQFVFFSFLLIVSWLICLCFLFFGVNWNLLIRITNCLSIIVYSTSKSCNHNYIFLIKTNKQTKILHKTPFDKKNKKKMLKIHVLHTNGLFNVLILEMI